MLTKGDKHFLLLGKHLFLTYPLLQYMCVYMCVCVCVCV